MVVDMRRTGRSSFRSISAEFLSLLKTSHELKRSVTNDRRQRSYILYILWFSVILRTLERHAVQRDEYVVAIAGRDNEVAAVQYLRAQVGPQLIPGDHGKEDAALRRRTASPSVSASPGVRKCLGAEFSALPTHLLISRPFVPWM